MIPYADICIEIQSWENFFDFVLGKHPTRDVNFNDDTSNWLVMQESSQNLF